MRGPRVQADRKRYDQFKAFFQIIETSVCWWEVIDDTSGDRVSGVVLSSGEKITCDAVILTTGTFLREGVHRRCVICSWSYGR